jgi:hypothetical protein
MNSISAIDRELLAIAGGAAAETIDDVIQRMESIDKLLKSDDGLKWFNRLYLLVTTEVKENHSADVWNDASWLMRLDEEIHQNPDHSSPEHADYERVNTLLEEVLPRSLEFLATGMVGLVAESTGKIGQLLAIWNVRAARDLAWDFSDHLQRLPDFSRPLALSMQDKTTGALGRSLLRVI